jgi:hypothetical protein
MLPYVCRVCNIWFECSQLPLLFLIACVCSLYLVWNVRPVCPIYFSGQSIHLIWYTPLLSYLSICGQGFIRFCIVFCSECSSYLCFFTKFCDFFVSFLQYVKMAHFVVWSCGPTFLLCLWFFEWLMLKFLLYLLLYNISCIIFSSFLLHLLLGMYSVH